MSADYSIIVPAFNEAIELPETLRAIRGAMAEHSLSGECIVVDNNSSDETSTIAKKHGADQVVFEPINQISRARNAGAKVSSGHYIIFIDADTRISPTLLNEAIKHLESGRFVGGGAIVEFEKAVGLIGNFGITLWKHISQWTLTAAGSFLFCRRDAFEETGGFDLRLYAGEEIRFSRLLRKWGKSRKMDFVIINIATALTSARKLKQHNPAKLLLWLIFLPLYPIFVRFRFFCGFWYRRDF